MSYSITRFHDFSAGHRVVGHENKCANLHGHNYRVHFHCHAAQLDKVGRVIDFGCIKEKLCMWLEDNWDHKFLMWARDPVGTYLLASDDFGDYSHDQRIIGRSIVKTSFNPTAENMAVYLVEVIGPQQLEGTGVKLFRVDVEETRKCSATYELDNG